MNSKDEEESSRIVSDWWPIFTATRLADLKKHCRKVTLKGEDLASLVMAGQSPGPFKHMPVFKHHHPQHLELSDDDLKAFGTAKAGETADARLQKTLRKIDQMFKERRLFCGHLFWFIEDPQALPKAWNFFHFDDKSTSKRQNHWKEGSHIHLMSHLTHPELALIKLLDTLDREERPWLSGGLHIRYKR